MLSRSLPRRTLLILISAALTLAACNVGAAPVPTTDINAINTAAIDTAVAQISAQQTQTALAAPSATPGATNTPLTLATFALSPNAASPTGNAAVLPTLSFNTTPGTTPLAGFTPIGSPIAPAATKSLGDECSNNVFIADITVPDGSVFKPGEDFLKIWRVKNTGSCTWDDGYTLVFVAGDYDIDPPNFHFDQPNDFVKSGSEADVGVHLTAPKAVGKYQGHWKMQNDRGSYFGTFLSVYFEVQK